MKRLIAIFFVFLYTVSVSGMVIQHHYCEGSLMASGLAGTVDDCCMMEEESGSDPCEMECCLTKSDVVKVDADQEKPAGFKLISIDDISGFAASFFLFHFTSSQVPSFVHLSEIKQPPKVPLNLLYSVFRI